MKLQASQNPHNGQQSGFSLFSNNIRQTIKGCQNANYDKALQIVAKQSNRWDKQKQVTYNPDITYFKRFGPGIYLFFGFTKILSIVFGVMALIALIPLIYNLIQGTGFSSIIKSSGVYFGMTTIGALNPTPFATTSLDSTTSNKYKMLNAIPDLVISFIFLAFILYWNRQSNKMNEEVKRQVNFKSFSTIEVINFPKNTNQQQIQKFFSQFGPVKEVAIVKNYSELIYISKEMYQKQNGLKQLKLSMTELNQNTEKNINKCKEYEQQINQLQKLFQQLNNKDQEPIKYFVVFEKPSIRMQSLQTFKKYNSFCVRASSIPDQHKIRGEVVKIKTCHNEPAQIIWENQHIGFLNRVGRSILQFVLVFVAIVFTFLLISLLNIATPSTSTNLNISAYDSTTIQSVNNQTLAYVWCVTNKDSLTSGSTIDSFCNKYINRYYFSIVIGLLISFLVVGVKTLLKTIVVYLAKFKRYTTFSDQSGSIMRSLFFIYITTTALITFLLQAKIFSISFKDIIGHFIDNSYLNSNLILLTQYSDFNPMWYTEIGYKITLTWLILAFQIPLVNPFIYYLLQKYNHWKCLKEKTQKKMQEWIMPGQFQIQDHYANILLILFVGLALSPGMPVILISCACAFGLRHFYFKFIFIRFSRVPRSLDDALNQKLIKFLPFALIVHFGFGIWMYGTESVFKHENSFIGGLVNSGYSLISSIGFLIQRMGTSWYYTLGFGMSVVILIMKFFLYDTLVNLCFSKHLDKIPTIHLQQKIKISYIENQQNLIKNTNSGKIKSQKSLTNSYKIQNNPDYFEILAIMEKLKKQRK